MTLETRFYMLVTGLFILFSFSPAAAQHPGAKGNIGGKRISFDQLGVFLRSTGREDPRQALMAAKALGGLHLQAAQGKIPALIFLAKNLLGYRDARSNEPSGPNAGPDQTKPKRFSGSMEELLEQYRELTLGKPPARG
jgi:hypothetical protein